MGGSGDLEGTVDTRGALPTTVIGGSSDWTSFDSDLISGGPRERGHEAAFRELDLEAVLARGRAPWSAISAARRNSASLGACPNSSRSPRARARAACPTPPSAKHAPASRHRRPRRHRGRTSANS